MLCELHLKFNGIFKPEVKNFHGGSSILKEWDTHVFIRFQKLALHLSSNPFPQNTEFSFHFLLPFFVISPLLSFLYTVISPAQVLNVLHWMSNFQRCERCPSLRSILMWSVCTSIKKLLHVMLLCMCPAGGPNPAHLLVYRSSQAAYYVGRWDKEGSWQMMGRDVWGWLSGCASHLYMF